MNLKEFLFLILVLFTFQSTKAQTMSYDTLRGGEFKFNIPESFVKEKSWYKSEKFKAVLTVSPTDGYSSSAIKLSEASLKEANPSTEILGKYTFSCNYQSSDIFFFKASLSSPNPSHSFLLNCVIKSEDVGLYLMCIFSSDEHVNELVKVLKEAYSSIEQL